MAELVIDSPVGALRLGSAGDALCGLWFGADAPVGSGERAGVLGEAADQLDSWFAGDRVDFDLPLAPRGTDFQLAVWAQLREVPYGQTTTYGEIARRLDMRPGASRAVGLANGANPISIIVPCHRVIGADGTLTGYGGGLPTKRYLLAHEQRVSGQQQLF